MRREGEEEGEGERREGEEDREGGREREEGDNKSKTRSHTD